MKSNVADVVASFVEQELALDEKIFIDLIPSDGEGVCVRHDPAPAAERRFNDGSRLVRWNLSFYARDKDAAAARERVKMITDRLDGATVADPETSTSISCEAATLPQFIGIDDKNFTTYGAGITAQYLESEE